ncbi:hypothetical protein Rcae01_05979 [Novipirellula caenicola]|uniref:acetolactate synthase n=2 Tax=Novipirellula caenicola TaxID=1536901 RepID=A0ABP9W0H6_9BACT
MLSRPVATRQADGDSRARLAIHFGAGLSPCWFLSPKLSCYARQSGSIQILVDDDTPHLMSNDNQRHVLSALVQNVPGVLAHISGMLASRGFNIDSLAVGETENKQLSRMTFVVVGDDRVLEQVGKQLEKIVTVVQVLDVSSRDFVERDLLLMKIKAPAGPVRSEIRELVDIFRGKIVDVGPSEVMVEISGRENKVQAFIERMRPYGITELARTGRIAMVRSDAGVPRLSDSPKVVTV